MCIMYSYNYVFIHICVRKNRKEKWNWKKFALLTMIYVLYSAKTVLNRFWRRWIATVKIRYALSIKNSLKTVLLYFGIIKNYSAYESWTSFQCILHLAFYSVTENFHDSSGPQHIISKKNDKLSFCSIAQPNV